MHVAPQYEIRWLKLLTLPGFFRFLPVSPRVLVHRSYLQYQMDGSPPAGRSSMASMISPTRAAGSQSANGQADIHDSPGPGPSEQLMSDHHGTSSAQPELDTVGSNEQQGQKRKRPRPENPRSATGYSRKRAVAACQSCRARKIKCNNARPACGRCLSSMTPCVYEDTQDLSAFDPASIAILDRLNQVLTRLDDIPSKTQPQVLPGPADLASTPTSRISGSLQILQAAVPAPDDEYDELHIPSGKTTPDAVLQWPIFESRYPVAYLIDATFAAEMPDDDCDLENGPKKSKIRGGGYNEDAVLDRVQSFLDLVHIKNPILDPETICSYAQDVVEDGLEWDSASCLVLLACALGSIAKPYEGAHNQAHQSSESFGTEQKQDLQDAERYYHLARRRIGLVGRGIRASQCHFLAGVYLMYTLRPLSAWQEFHSATRAIQIYLKSQRCQGIPQAPAGHDSSATLKKRRLEQRLYWSCYKSECELRVEMDIPNSLLADLHYPDLYPSPPDAAPSPVEIVRTPGSAGPRSSAYLNQRLHEQCWFYYLTEITLRRIANRVLNVFYQKGPSAWVEESLPSMASMAREFEQQLQDWHAQLPAPIRFEEGEIPSEELPYMVWCRVVEIKAWVYRPFLFYAIHNPSHPPGRSIALPFLDKALACSFNILGKHSMFHRHHGTWYGLRQTVTEALLILGAVKSGTLNVPMDWRSVVQRGMSRLTFWEDEVPGVTRALRVVADYLSLVSHL